MWWAPVEKRTTGLFGASQQLTARNKWVLRRMERRLALERDAAAERHRRARAAMRAKRAEAYAGRSPHKRAVSGELIGDAAGAVWSALWRRGA
jgi:hypothetical protein